LTVQKSNFEIFSIPTLFKSLLEIPSSRYKRLEGSQPARFYCCQGLHTSEGNRSKTSDILFQVFTRGYIKNALKSIKFTAIYTAM